MYRQLYQMGGIGTLPMDFGQPLQVPQQPQPSFSSAQNITMNPLLNYGQPQLGGGTPLTMAGGGISRLGYQEGGMGMMQDQMQGQMMSAAGGEEQGLSQEKGTMSLAIIIKLLIDQGIDPETAKQLAIQIQQAFAQGGTPAVEALANQLEQEEGMQQPMMMAEGGLTSIDRARDMLQSRAPSGEFLAYINPQEAGILKLIGGAGQDVNVRGVPSFFLKSVFKAVSGVVKGVSKAVKSVAKSPIGKLALTAAAVYFGGPMLASSFGISGAAGAAWAGGLANSALQIASGQKFNIGEALLSAGGAYVGAGGLSGTPTPTIDPLTGLPTNTITGTITQPSIQVGALESNLGGGFNPSITPGITGTITQPSSFFSPTEYGSALSTSAPSYTGFESDISSMVGKGPNAAFTLDQATLDPAAGAGSQIYNPGAVQTPPNIFERGIASVQDFGTKLMSDPIGTIGRGVGATYDLAKKYPAEAILAATAAIGALTPQQPGEPDDSYQQRKAEHDARVAEYITLYGGEAKVYSPSFYAMEGAVDPFAGRSTYAAMGGRIGYAEGSTSFERQTLEKKGYGDMMKNMTPREISQLYDSVMGTFSRRFQAEGSMPMGEPRKNPAGIMELDYRAKGGFVPPVGIKEKADDIPAMLSNNEFVFTANAVRNAGGGNVNKGAERMYGLMKQLEAGGIV